ncbi:hypothetical protein [Phytohabitans kaempferiae]|uniref:Uncharacterized protein n=1 Tax=Phytohabitans kaempferiae TaxID=1620943 RepID=A0ABV6MHC2_9ACTN
MRDPGNLPNLLARDLADARWPEPAEIRARGRRRTVRAVVAAPAALVVLVTSVWLLAGPVADRAAPAPGGGDPTSAPAPDGGDRPPGWFGPEALVQPEDVGERHHLTNEHAYAPGEYPTWTFSVDACGAYAGLGVTAPLDYLWMRINIVTPDGDTSGALGIHAELASYPQTGAEQVMEDVRRVIEACAEYGYAGGEASTEERPARVEHEYEVLEEGFAGDDSLLIRHLVRSLDARTGEPVSPEQDIVSIKAVVRVGDRVEVIQSDQGDPARMREIAIRAARRL